MITKNNISQGNFFDLEKVFQKLLDLEKENLNLRFELEVSKKETREAIALAEIKANVYSGVKKYFK